ncbi:MAG TPA: hypothetical protein VLB83_00935 [Candidatus Paceibacterota bacterium]|nr:hypothetical protein [Candidatus Paceibacterota bacterium]
MHKIHGERGLRDGDIALPFRHEGRAYYFVYEPAKFPYIFNARYLLLDDERATVLEFDSWTDGFPILPIGVRMLGDIATISAQTYLAIAARTIETYAATASEMCARATAALPPEREH